MKTDIDIKDDIYNWINGSILQTTVTGKLRKTKRPLNSTSEDIVISVLANRNSQLQEGFVNINIYVQDVYRNGQYEENSARCRELSRIAFILLEKGYGESHRFELEEQRLYEVGNEHVINNRILYQQSNI